MKFGVVGVIAAVIDFGVLNLLVGVFHMHNVIAGTISFLVSLVFNYLADNMSQDTGRAYYRIV